MQGNPKGLPCFACRKTYFADKSAQKQKFRSSLFKGLWGQGAKPLSHSAECENFYTHKRSGGEPKQSGELFWRGEPYQGVPRKV